MATKQTATRAEVTLRDLRRDEGDLLDALVALSRQHGRNRGLDDRDGRRPRRPRAMKGSDRPARFTFQLGLRGHPTRLVPGSGGVRWCQ
jgi:hypothetical protein